MLVHRLSERWETARLIELLRRAARRIREDAVTHTDDERHFLALQADDLEGLATVYEAGAELGDRMMARAVELALRQLDEQIDAGIPREAQNVDYALIYRQVREEQKGTA